MAKRNDVSVKMDPEAVRVARNVASYQQISLAEYLSRVVMEKAKQDWDEILDREQKAKAAQAIHPKGKGRKGE
jgi:hypothetical protein